MTVSRTKLTKSLLIHLRDSGRSLVVRTLKKLLFELGLGDFNLNSLVNLLLVPALVIGIVLDRGREESVDKGRLAQAGFTSDLQREAKLANQHDRPRALAMGKEERCT